MSFQGGSFLPYLLISLAIVMFISVKAKKLTTPAALYATGIGLVVLQAAQLRGVLMLLTFFLLSVWATAHKRTIKGKLHADNLAGMGRTAGQVFANGGVAGLAAIMAIIDPFHADIYLIMMAGSLASALADTLSSELGMVYGRRFYNIITFKKEANGLDGVVSLEGFLIGAVGACIIALIYTGFHKTAIIVILAGILGNLTDSILGATLERKHKIGNNMVNFLNTLFAALLAMLMHHI